MAAHERVVVTGVVYTAPGFHPHPVGAEIDVPAAHVDELVAAGGVKRKPAAESPPAEAAPAPSPTPAAG